MRLELNKADAETVFSALEQVARKGQNVYVEWQRDCKTRKTMQAEVTKRVRAAVRYGVNYANIASIKTAIADGLRGEVESLPWGQWRTGYENRIIDQTGNEYCRLAASTFASMRRDITWYLNGTIATFAQVKPYLLSSELPTGETPTVFTVKPQTIIAVGAE